MRIWACCHATETAPTYTPKIIRYSIASSAQDRGVRKK